MKAVLVLGIFVLLTINAYPQTGHSWSEDKKFGEYLFKTHLYTDCLVLFTHLNENKLAFTQQQNDSIYFYIARSFEQLHELDSMENFLDEISNPSPLFNYASIRSSLFLAKNGNYNKAEVRVQSVNELSDTISSLKLFHLASLALLKRDTARFQLYKEKIKTKPVLFEPETDRLFEQENVLRGAKKKSPFIAGTLSALVPGLGKIYAGKPRQGLTSILPIAVLSVQAYEGFNKGGIKNGRFIIYGSLLSIFYIGNIWGSVLSVGIKKRELYNESDYQILSVMQLTLSRTFE